MKPVLVLRFPLTSQFGGAERHTLLLLDELARRGAPIAFVGSCSVLLREFRARGWPALRWWAGKEPVTPALLLLYPLTAPLVALGLFAIIAGARLFFGARTLYCLSFTEKPLVSPIARALGLRVIWVEHVQLGRWLTVSPLRFPYCWWSRFCTVLTVSQVVAGQITSVGVRADRIVVVPPGVDIEPYRGIRRDAARWSTRFIIGTIGRIESEKGIDVIFRAFRTVREEIPHARLLVVGDGSHRADLERLARELEIDDRVEWGGFQADVAPWFAKLDCFVLASVRREASPIALLEAMAAGCPVVASNLGGIPETVEHERTGLLFEPKNDAALARAVVRLYRDPDFAAALVKEGRTRVEARSSLPRTLERLTALFA